MAGDRRSEKVQSILAPNEFAFAHDRDLRHIGDRTIFALALDDGSDDLRHPASFLQHLL